MRDWLSPDHNERRQLQRQIENEIGRQLANYLQELEDNQERTVLPVLIKKVEDSNRDDEFIDPDCFLV